MIIALKKFLPTLSISLFIILNFAAIIFSNRPHWLPISSFLGAPTAHKLQVYAHIVGLDNRWEMFSYIYRNDWKLLFKGVYDANFESELLPMALQGERSWYERWFYDFREAKLRLNIFRHAQYRQRYAELLCRRFASLDQRKLLAVDVVYERRKIHTRNQAHETGVIYGSKVHSRLLDRVRCS